MRQWQRASYSKYYSAPKQYTAWDSRLAPQCLHGEEVRFSDAVLPSCGEGTVFVLEKSAEVARTRMSTVPVKSDCNSLIRAPTSVLERLMAIRALSLLGMGP